MKTQRLLFTIFICVLTCFPPFGGTKCNSQNIGINGTGVAPDPSALLDIDAAPTNNKGLLIPRLTTAERNAIVSPAQSLLIFNTTDSCFQGFIGTQWISFGCVIGCSVPFVPVAETNTVAQTQITWNWSAAGATTYYYNTVNNFSTATNNGLSNSFIQTGLSCASSYTLYVWASNSCGNSAAVTITESTSACCAGGPPTSTCGGLTTTVDVRDGKTYNIVDIGTQCWMAQNLDYGTYVTSFTGQGGSGTQKYCYSNNTANCTTYGGLYVWSEVMNGAASCNGDPTCPPCMTSVQGICPSGWHVPSHYEWTLMEKNVGTNPVAFPYDVTTSGLLGTDEGGNLKEAGSVHWGLTNTGATNSSGFTALPGGYCTSAGAWGGMGVSGNGYWWTANAWGRRLDYNSAQSYRATGNVANAFSVRCVKD